MSQNSKRVKMMSESRVDLMMRVIKFNASIQYLNENSSISNHSNQMQWFFQKWTSLTSHAFNLRRKVSESLFLFILLSNKYLQIHSNRDMLSDGFAARAQSVVDWNANAYQSSENQAENTRAKACYERCVIHFWCYLQ